jgi:hypothetical protein
MSPCAIPHDDDDASLSSLPLLSLSPSLSLPLCCRHLPQQTRWPRCRLFRPVPSFKDVDWVGLCEHHRAAADVDGVFQSHGETKISECVESTIFRR